MAYKSVRQPGSELEALYNLTMVVGPQESRCPNRIDDVLLVQLCLKQIFQNRSMFQPALPALNNPVDTDGKWGPISEEALLKFQTYIQRSGRSIRADGFVNPAAPTTDVSPISHTTYTIIWLNSALKHVVGGLFEHLEDASITPFALQVALIPSTIL